MLVNQCLLYLIILLGQWANEVLTTYIQLLTYLVATQKDFEKTRRKKLMGRIATGEWDAVLIAHSSFGLIPMSKEYEQKYMEESNTMKLLMLLKELK